VHSRKAEIDPPDHVSAGARDGHALVAGLVRRDGIRDDAEIREGAELGHQLRVREQVASLPGQVPELVLPVPEQVEILRLPMSQIEPDESAPS